jgi:hypothetical protein
VACIDSKLEGGVEMDNCGKGINRHETLEGAAQSRGIPGSWKDSQERIGNDSAGLRRADMIVT